MRIYFLFLFVISLSIGSCNAQIFHKNASRNAERKLFGKSIGNKKDVKVKEPRSVLKAKRKQESNERKLKKDYKQAIKKSQKRSYDIQTPEVQTRMKINQKNTVVRNKSKKHKEMTSTKKAGKKYK